MPSFSFDLVGDVEQLRQLAFVDKQADVGLQFALIHSVGDGSHDDLLLLTDFLQLPFALNLDAAGPLFVNLAQRRAIRDDAAAEREIRALASSP